MWETLKPKQMANGKWQMANLNAHLLTAKYQGKTLTTWILFTFHDTLYYPYGASSTESREVMASNLVMWEAIRFGKKLGLKKFDMWGAMGPNPDKKDPWYGFHNFKEKYGPEHIEFVGSYDLVISPILYQVYKIADKLRWLILRFKT
jgi:lipid II:glycine glycyltransferase (peptidoglycan interpeptide bridge formation enzyme)